MRLLLISLLAPALLLAQAPRIGIIDFYGLRKISQERVRKVLGVREGDPLPASKSDLEDRLEKIPGVVYARLQAVCCDADRAILYVGIEEKDAAHFEFRLPPREELSLPADMGDTYHRFLGAFERAARAGQTQEDVVLGHALSRNPEARALQQHLQVLAESHLDNLRQVLRNAIDPEQRAIAAYAIGYAPTKRLVVDDLQYAMRDADESVRANAMRSLGAIAALGASDPQLGIRVEPTWFVEMLNSIVWSDRYRAATALVNITEKRNRYTIAQLRERAIGSLIEMARWKMLSHALPAFILLGRVAGISEREIQAHWTRGNRDALVDRALKDD